MKHKKLFLKILLSIFIIIILLISSCFLFHKVKSKEEYNKLKQLGYINKYEVDGYKLNIYKVGNPNSKYKIIGISGFGVNNYSIEMSFVNEKLKDKYEFIYIDRAGYGYSDDTSKKQTVEQIVSDYRKVLESANIKGSYILMPHSIGGVYATYWESMYPEEVEGVIFIDGTQMGLNVYEKEDYQLTIEDYIDFYGCKLGLQRFIPSAFDKLPSVYTKENQTYTEYLNIKSCTNKALLSEKQEKNNNMNKAYQNIKTNDIKKIYISSSFASKTEEDVLQTVEWMKKINKDSKIPNKEQIEEIINQSKKMEEEMIEPYIRLLGNTKLILLPGSHYIFEQRPDELAKIIEDFIDNI